MKAVGEAFEIARCIRFDKPKLIADDGFERQAFLGSAPPDQQTGNPIRHFQQTLRDADIDHQHARHQLGLQFQRRQGRAKIGPWRCAFR